MATTTSLGNPIIVTGTAVSSEKIIDNGLGGAVYIKFIKWHNPTTAGQLCTLTDDNGRIIADFKCEVDEESQWAPIWSYFPSIYVSDMDSGTLYIYTR